MKYVPKPIRRILYIALVPLVLISGILEIVIVLLLVFPYWILTGKSLLDANSPISPSDIFTTWWKDLIK